MADMMFRTRQQGIEERTEQVRNKNARVLDAPTIPEIQKQKIIDKINANKIAFRAEQERLKAEQVLHQVGLPERQHKDDQQEKIQANQHQDRVFAGVKFTERFRMGQEQERQNRAQKDHAFTMKEKDADQRVLEAGNNPTPLKDNDINDKLARQEEKFKKIMRDPNIPLETKARVFKKMAQGIKTREGNRIKLKEHDGKARQKALMQKVALKDRKRVKNQAKNVNKRTVTTIAMKQLERQA